MLKIIFLKKFSLCSHVCVKRLLILVRTVNAIPKTCRATAIIQCKWAKTIVLLIQFGTVVARHFKQHWVTIGTIFQEAHSKRLSTRSVSEMHCDHFRLNGGYFCRIWPAELKFCGVGAPLPLQSLLTRATSLPSSMGPLQDLVTWPTHP